MLSDLYPVADDIQHGDLAQIGNLLSTFVSSTPSRLRATLDGRRRLDTSAYMVLISNMPYLGPHFRIAPDISCNDNRLDVFIFSDMSKLSLIAYAMQSSGGAVEDDRVKHYRVKRLKIRTDPQMPVLADGVLLDLGPITALVHHRALAVMVGATDSALEGQPVTTPVADRELATHG